MGASHGFNGRNAPLALLYPSKWQSTCLAEILGSSWYHWALTETNISWYIWWRIPNKKVAQKYLNSQGRHWNIPPNRVKAMMMETQSTAFQMPRYSLQREHGTPCGILAKILLRLGANTKTWVLRFFLLCFYININYANPNMLSYVIDWTWLNTLVHVFVLNIFKWNLKTCCVHLCFRTGCAIKPTKTEERFLKWHVWFWWYQYPYSSRHVYQETQCLFITSSPAPFRMDQRAEAPNELHRSTLSSTSCCKQSWRLPRCRNCQTYGLNQNSRTVWWLFAVRWLNT